MAFSWLKVPTSVFTFKTLRQTALNQKKALAGAFTVITNLLLKLYSPHRPFVGHIPNLNCRNRAFVGLTKAESAGEIVCLVCS